jgi:hypothetical protein
MSKIRYYDVTKMVGKRQKFVAKTNEKPMAERIAKLVIKDSGTSEARIIAWYETAGNRPKFKVLEKFKKE